MTAGQGRDGQGPRVFLLSLVAQTIPVAAAAELKYPKGIQPGDQISGTEGEYFRYKTVLIKPPDDNDRMESLRMAGDVMCSACEVMLQNLVRRSESLSEDDIMDQLDGELEGTVELTDNPQENRVNKNRKGCNKHFKDELLLKGHVVRRCQEPGTSGPEAGRHVWCLDKLSSMPTEQDVDTYSTRNEAAFYACENTIGRYGQELAGFVAERAESAVALADVAAAACREAARCEGAAAGRKARPAGSGKRRGRRRGGRATGGAEL